MFDIGWSEILVIAVVAVVVVGPKELPRMLRSFGNTMGQVRRMSNDFKRQFDEAVREAEREAGFEDTKNQLKTIVTPLKNFQNDVDKTMRTASATPTAKPAPTPMPAPGPEAASAAPQEAAPVKTGAAPVEGSGAA